MGLSVTSITVQAAHYFKRMRNIILWSAGQEKIKCGLRPGARKIRTDRNCCMSHISKKA